jgi:hypothetical protein
MPKTRFTINYTGEIYVESKPIVAQKCTSLTFRNQGTNSVHIRELSIDLATNESIALNNDPGGEIDQTFNPVFATGGTNKLLVIRAFTELIPD